MAFTLCSSDAIIFKAGSKASSEATTSAAIMEAFSEMAEARISAVSRHDWVTAYPGLKAGIKEVLDDTCSSIAANFVVAWDMSTYTSRVEAEDIINVNRDVYLNNLGLLKDQKRVDFIK